MTHTTVQASPTVLMKVRMENGSLAIFDVAPNHVGSRDLVVAYGQLQYKQRRHTWYKVEGGSEVSVIGRDQGRQLDKLRIDFEIPHTMWGVQVFGHKTGCGGNDPTWNWLHPTGGEPYQFHTKEEAESTMRMCYPQSTPDEVRVQAFE